MNNNPKVLVAAPTSTFKSYIFLDWLIHMSNLTYSNYDILVCDNSQDKTYHKELQKMGVNCLYVSPKGKELRQYIAESQNALRDYFLRNPDYQFYMSIETDVIPPRNIIEKLLISNKDIIGAPYFWKFGKESKPLLSYFIKKGKKEYSTYEPDLKECMQFFDGTVKQIYENGIGCSLIAHRVLEKIPFRWEKGNPAHSDTFFYNDAFSKGYKNFMDTSIICKHYNSDWGLNIDHFNAKDVVIKH